MTTSREDPRNKANEAIEILLDQRTEASNLFRLRLLGPKGLLLTKKNSGASPPRPRQTSDRPSDEQPREKGKRRSPES